MAKTALIIRTYKPNDAIELSYQWAEIVKQYFISDGWNIIDLGKENATAEKLEQEINNAELVIFYGHGEEDKWCGISKPILNSATANLLKNKKIYVMACLTAKQLGIDTINNKAICYLGYNDYVVGYKLEKCSQALGKCVNQGILAMLENKCNFAQAHQIIINEYNKWIDYFSVEAGNTDIKTATFAGYLRHNRDALQLLGDNTAVL